MEDYNFFLELLKFFSENQMMLPLIFIVIFIFFFLIVNVIKKKSFVKGLTALKSLFGGKKKMLKELNKIIEALNNKVLILENKDSTIEQKLIEVDSKMDTLIKSFDKIAELKLEVMKTIVGWFLTRISCKTFRLFANQIESFKEDNPTQFSNYTKIVIQELKDYIRVTKEQMGAQLAKHNDNQLSLKFCKFVENKFLPSVIDYIETKLLSLNPLEGRYFTKKDVQQMHSFIIGFSGDILSHLHNLDVLSNGISMDFSSEDIRDE